MALIPDESTTIEIYLGISNAETGDGISATRHVQCGATAESMQNLVVAAVKEMLVEMHGGIDFQVDP